MSPKGRAKPDSVSVAETMQQVRWDYSPEDDEADFGVPAGTFFQEFPWDDPGEAPKEPPNKSSKGSGK